MDVKEDNYRKREGKTLASVIALHKQCIDFRTSTANVSRWL